MSYNATMRVWRGDEAGGALQDFTVEVNEGEVVLDIIHRLQQTQTPGPRGPLELQSRQVRVMLSGGQRQAPVDVYDADVDVRRRRSGHGDADPDVPGDP